MSSLPSVSTPLDEAKADELLAKIDEIAAIFWETKKAA